jgi:ethanolamine utilization protein EutN
VFLGKVRGTVVASVLSPDLEGATLRIVQPVNHDMSSAGALIVAVDMLASREGDFVYLVKGKEAIMPFKKILAPIDAAIVGRVDGMDLR